MIICPECGDEVESLIDGACSLCTFDKQEELDSHNSRYDYWQGLSDKEREDQIRWSSNHYG